MCWLPTYCDLLDKVRIDLNTGIMCGPLSRPRTQQFPAVRPPAIIYVPPVRYVTIMTARAFVHLPAFGYEPSVAYTSLKMTTIAIVGYQLCIGGAFGGIQPAVA
jgi:hypothetical protein